MKSNFNEDLSKEALLGKYLDNIYPNIMKGFEIKRISDIEMQHKGIDLILSKDGTDYYIDEKAQLDYLNIDLPTAAFEITFMKDGEQKWGWLYDNYKETQKYFIITSIYLNTDEIKDGFNSCTITSVDRSKLISALNKRGLNHKKIIEINQKIRSGEQEGKIEIDELDFKTEGRFHFSKRNKSEQPINIVFYLKFLLDSKIAKIIYK